MSSFRVFYRTRGGCLSSIMEVAQLIGVSLIGVVWVLGLRFRAASSSQCLNAARAVAAGYRASGFVQ